MKSRFFARSMLATCCSLVVCLMAVDQGLADTLVGPTLDNYVNSGTAVELTTSASSYSANLSTFENFTSDVYAILGSSATVGESDMRWSDYYTIAWSGAGVELNTGANGYRGFVVYKFVTEEGTETDAGGTISILYGYRGTPSTGRTTHWVGVNTSVVTSSEPAYSNLDNASSFTKAYLTSESTTYGNYRETLTLDIPEGVTEFYVAIADEGTGVRSGYQSLSVSANLVPVPEPMTVSCLAAAVVLGFKRRRQK